MIEIHITFLAALLSILNFSFAQIPSTNASSLNLTTISATHGKSIIECWQLPGLTSSTESGTTGAQSLFLGPTSNATYTILPAGFNGGLHNAPSPQIVAFLSGLIHITLPNSTQEAWIQGGRYGIVLAVDTADLSKFGHRTVYPGGADTVAVEIPFGGGVVPGHRVLHLGACTWDELVGS